MSFIGVHGPFGFAFARLDKRLAQFVQPAVGVALHGPQGHPRELRRFSLREAQVITAHDNQAAPIWQRVKARAQHAAVLRGGVRVGGNAVRRPGGEQHPAPPRAPRRSVRVDDATPYIGGCLRRVDRRPPQERSRQRRLNQVVRARLVARKQKGEADEGPTLGANELLEVRIRIAHTVKRPLAPRKLQLPHDNFPFSPCPPGPVLIRAQMGGRPMCCVTDALNLCAVVSVIVGMGAMVGVRSGAAGDDAFEEFVQARAGHLFKLALLLSGHNRADAEDLLQLALERAYRRRGLFSQDTPEAYVRRVLVNASIDKWRVRLRHKEVSLSDVHPGLAVPDGTEASADRDLLLRGLARLPARQRAVLILRYWEDLPEAAIAETLGCSVGTVKSHVSRGLARLREVVQQVDPPTNIEVREQ
ncbi:MAG: putative polymerase ECF-subfamily sigma factor [Myxococcales bacterium]|nr:putative polymerase ECF-subfamily sigma factor [Myxococcales bacterium]